MEALATLTAVDAAAAHVGPKPDTKPDTTPLRDRLGDLGARAASGVLFALLSANIVRDFLATRHFTGLLLLASEALVVVFIVLRRRARVVDRTLAARVITGMSMLGPPLLRAGTEAPLLPDAVTAAVSVAGVLLVIAAKLTLGRSFGQVPANRGVVDSGPYHLMRHPIYTGYVISHIGFLAAHPTVMNIGLVVAGDAALVLRALYEERTLVEDDRYRAYCGRVGWHFVPGVF
jgi:protein-S-isoprenylcysteine O-methyltransferase Ste14